MTRKNISVGCDQSLEGTKENLRKTASLNYYDPSLKTAVVCDDSLVCISVILVQYDSNTQNPELLNMQSGFRLMQKRDMGRQSENPLLYNMDVSETIFTYLVGNSS